MPIDLTVVLTDEPGELAKLGQATGAAGVNIQGMCAFTGQGRGIIHLLVADGLAERAASATLGAHACKTLGDMFNDPRYWSTAGDLARESARLQCVRGRGPALPYCGPLMQSYRIRP